MAHELNVEGQNSAIQGDKMSLNPSSYCFVPSQVKGNKSSSNSINSDSRSINSKKAAADTDTTSVSETDQKTTAHGNKSNLECDSKPGSKQKSVNSNGSIATTKEKYHAGAQKWGKYKKKENKNKKRNDDSARQQKGKVQEGNDFSFPDGGWVCSQCQNYNFLGRVKCNRCQKPKSKLDANGKPKHLLKPAATSSSNLDTTSISIQSESSADTKSYTDKSYSDK